LKNFNKPYLELNDEELGFSLEEDDKIKVEINYFSIKQENKKILDFLVDNSYPNQNQTIEIISEHYIN
jgi:hypothetical protein